jgi:hypothetical protein
LYVDFIILLKNYSRPTPDPFLLPLFIADIGIGGFTIEMYGSVLIGDDEQFPGINPFDGSGGSVYIDYEVAVDY